MSSRLCWTLTEDHLQVRLYFSFPRSCPLRAVSQSMFRCSPILAYSIGLYASILEMLHKRQPTILQPTCDRPNYIMAIEGQIVRPNI
jgi:hypothetical protein